MEKIYNGPMRFAHRGLVQTAPDNTLEACMGAVEFGCEGIEIDVQLTKDGEVILSHDDNFTRMTIGHPTGFTNKQIKNLTLEEIRQIELPYANHTLPVELPSESRIENLACLPFLVMGQHGGHGYEEELIREPRMTHLITLNELDEKLCSVDSKITVEVEVKVLGAVKKIFDILSKSKRPEGYIVFSGNRNIINEIQSVAATQGVPDGVKLGANIRCLSDEWKRDIAQMQLFEVGLNAEKFGKEDISWLKDRGINVFSNLGDYPEWWETLCSLDVMGFKTNYAQAFTKWWMNREA